MLQIRLCGSPLIVFPKARLIIFILVFLRMQLVLLVLSLPFKQVMAEQTAHPESKASNSFVNQLLPQVIVNHSVSEHAISLKKLRAIFAMKLRFWGEGQAITVFVLANDDPIHGAFCKKILNIFPNQLESVWYRQIYTGTGQAPIEVASESELIERVKSTPGAIGYIKNKNDNLKWFSDEITILNID